MAKPDESIDPRILKSAKEEFLKNGFEKASLKTICTNANVTTGALYKRYKGKEELFGAIVQPTLDDLNEILESKKIENRGYLTDEQLKLAWNMDEAAMLWWFDFLYQRKDGFVLLSAFWATIYEPFIHDFSWDEIVEHSHFVCLLFDWYQVLGI